MREVDVHSGQVGFGANNDPSIFYTVVGVCIAVCIWDKVKKSGGMCHYRLPEEIDGVDAPADNNDYGEKAILNLLKKFKHSGSKISHLQARILGGGQLHYGDYMEKQRIGERNIDIAMEVLSKFAIPIIGKSIGGDIGRHIRFNTRNGQLNFREVRECVNFPDQTFEQVSHAHPDKISVLVIDNATHSRKRLKRLIERDSDFSVMADVENIAKAEELIKKHQPDVITLDVNTKTPDWLAFISRYMREHIIPTVIVSSKQDTVNDDVFSALKLGVFDLVDQVSLETIHATLKDAYQSKEQIELARALSLEIKSENIEFSENYCEKPLVVIGSSTGGVSALETIVRQLPENTPPICVVQHIAEVFSASLAEQLDNMSKVKVMEAIDGIEVENNHVYIAKGGRHMKLVQIDGGKLILRLVDEPLRNGFKPSVDYLFESVKKINGYTTVAVLLTGMGKDGAQGMLDLKLKGVYTLAQNEATSVVYGMAKVASEMGAVCETCPIEMIARAMLKPLVVADLSDQLSLQAGEPIPKAASAV